MSETTRLPVLAILGSASRDVLGHPGMILRLVWPYFAFASACLLAIHLRIVDGTGASFLARSLGLGWNSVTIVLGTLAATVAWQRRIILAEPVAGMAPLNRRVLRVLLWQAALAALLVLIVGPYLLIALQLDLVNFTRNAVPPAHYTLPGMALLAAGGLVGSYFCMRLSLILPAVAVDDDDLRAGASWRATGDVAWRLLGLFLLLAAIGWSLSQALGWLGIGTDAAQTAIAPDSGLLDLLGLTALDLVKLALALLNAGIMAEVYLRLRPA